MCKFLLMEKSRHLQGFFSLSTRICETCQLNQVLSISFRNLLFIFHHIFRTFNVTWMIGSNNEQSKWVCYFTFLEAYSRSHSSLQTGGQPCGSWIVTKPQYLSSSTNRQQAENWTSQGQWECYFFPHVCHVHQSFHFQVWLCLIYWLLWMLEDHTHLSRASASCSTVPEGHSG